MKKEEILKIIERALVSSYESGATTDYTMAHNKTILMDAVDHAEDFASDVAKEILAQLKQEEPREEDKKGLHFIYRDCHWCGGKGTQSRISNMMYYVCAECDRKESF